MNFAFFLRSKAVSFLKCWTCRLISGHEFYEVPLASGTVSRLVGVSAPRTVTPIDQSCLQVRRTLRVVRVVESGEPRAHVGRMMISGRMADVCAELDRLAACEASSRMT